MSREKDDVGGLGKLRIYFTSYNGSLKQAPFNGN